MLYSVDPATGAVSSIGSIGFSVTGLAYNPVTGVLYGSTSRFNNPDPELITINPSTGQGTLVGDFNVNGHTMADLAFDSSGVLYGWAEPSLDDLYRIDLTTGAATLVGDAGLSTSGSGLSFVNGTLYFTGTTDLRTVSPVDGSTTVVAALSGGATDGINSLATSSGGLLFGIRSDRFSPATTELITINTTTGVITSIGPSADNLDALEFGPETQNIPEPGTLVTLLGGLILLGAWPRKPV